MSDRITAEEEEEEVEELKVQRRKCICRGCGGFTWTRHRNHHRHHHRHHHHRGCLANVIKGCRSVRFFCVLFSNFASFSRRNVRKCHNTRAIRLRSSKPSLFAAAEDVASELRQLFLFLLKGLNRVDQSWRPRHQRWGSDPVNNITWSWRVRLNLSLYKHTHVRLRLFMFKPTYNLNVTA